MQIPEGKNIYFASDNHLGAPNQDESLIREKKFVAFLDEAKKDAAAIFLLGDLFDFWFEYKEVVPKGFVRTLGKLAEISDSGIPIFFLWATMIYGWMITFKKNSELKFFINHKNLYTMTNTF